MSSVPMASISPLSEARRAWTAVLGFLVAKTSSRLHWNIVKSALLDSFRMKRAKTHARTAPMQDPVSTALSRALPLRKCVAVSMASCAVVFLTSFAAYFDATRLPIRLPI